MGDVAGASLDTKISAAIEVDEDLSGESVTLWMTPLVSAALPFSLHLGEFRAGIHAYTPAGTVLAHVNVPATWHAAGADLSSRIGTSLYPSVSSTLGAMVKGMLETGAVQQDCLTDR